MKPNEVDRTVTGNLQGERITMGFAKGAEKHLIQLLTDLYSDPEKAIIREYSSNAMDSHQAAGITRPIEVSLPSPLAQFLTIKDYGVGLSAEDLRGLYSQYGSSSKRESNEFTGMLGIGSKSALTYSAQFTITAVQNGRRTVCAVSRDDDGSNTLTIVSNEATDEGNGVEIRIPAKTGNTLAAKAQEFFAFWPKGSVLLNGQPVKPTFNEALRVSDSVTLVRNGDHYARRMDSTVVMGNVPYPAGSALDAGNLGVPYGYAVIAHIPVGAVDFAPSREALSFTKTTNDYLAKVAAAFKANVVQAVQNEISKASSAHEAVAAVNRWAPILGRNKPASFSYGDRTLPTSIVRPPGGSLLRPDLEPRMLTTSAQSYRLSSASETRAVDLSAVDTSIFVTGYDMANFTATHKKKMLQWKNRERVGLHAAQFVLVNYPLGDALIWIDPRRVIDWATISAEVLPRTPSQKSGSTSTRLPGSYDIVTHDCASYEIPGDKIDQSNPIFYIHGNTQLGRRYSTLLASVEPAFTIVCLPGNRVDKFHRDNPLIPKVTDVLAAAHKSWIKKQTETARMALHAHHNGYSTAFKYLAALAPLKDPDLMRAIEIGKVDVNQLVATERQFGREGFNEPLDKKFTNPLCRYPLWDQYKAQNHKDAMRAYLDFSFEARA